MLITSLHPSLETICYILNFPKVNTVVRTEKLYLFYFFVKHHQFGELQKFHPALILPAKHNLALR